MDVDQDLKFMFLPKNECPLSSAMQLVARNAEKNGVISKNLISEVMKDEQKFSPYVCFMKMQNCRRL